MPVIFEKSAKSLAAGKFLYLLITLIVGGAFISLFFIVEDLSLVVKITSGLAVIISLLMSLRLIREALAILKNGKAWRVEITDQTLVWYSPIPEQMKSFTINLSDIQSVHRTQTNYRNSKRSPKIEFHLKQTNGKKLKLNPQMCGINPQKVFVALEKKGIVFEIKLSNQGPKIKIGV